MFDITLDKDQANLLANILQTSIRLTDDQDTIDDIRELINKINSNLMMMKG